MARHRRILGLRRPVQRPRRRRAPEQARQELLDAAERVYAELPPDQVGLKDIAREAGVSHALVTHYFGTYSGLVEAVLERRLAALRATIIARLREAGALARPAELIGLLFRALEDPVHLRLVRWLLGSERPSAATAFVVQERGLQRVASEVTNALCPGPDRQQIEAIELALLTAVSAAYGYALSKLALVRALGRTASPELDTSVQRTLAAMLQAYVREQLGPSAALP